MINILRKKDCCGCSACVSVCPVSCISWTTDHEGFDYPIVDQNQCIHCELCVKVCPVINRAPSIQPSAFACINQNDSVRSKSSSGGIFSLLAAEVLERNGVVFGACYDDNFNVAHHWIDSLEQLNLFQGSKYVQSRMGDGFGNVEQFLKKERVVLFTGTPCQAAGLKKFLRKDYPNLLVADLICHGVPSPKVFQLYRKAIAEQYLFPIHDIRFRDKSVGWKDFQIVVEFDQTTYHSEIWKDPYMRAFLTNLDLRPSCYDCCVHPYRSGSDITLGDYWGVQHIHPHLDDDRGVSLVLIRSPKGQDYFNAIREKGLTVESTNLELATPHNPCLVRSVQPHEQRERFFNGLDEHPILNWINECVKPVPGILALMKRITKRLIFNKYTRKLHLLVNRLKGKS